MAAGAGRSRTLLPHVYGETEDLRSLQLKFPLLEQTRATFVWKGKCVILEHLEALPHET